MSAADHRHEAPGTVRFAVLTVSDTRTYETDESGTLAVDLIGAAFHSVSARGLCKDEPETVARLVSEACARGDVDAVVVTGGTGVSSRDTTTETLARLYAPALPGFGELFRMLSFHEIGPAAMLSRATAGLIAGKPVFSLPGSTSAVKLALTRLVLPEAGHLVAQASR